MKGPHFFEKRKKEMARQQKAKEKADRKAQRKTGGADGAGVEGVDFFLDAEGNQVNADGTIVLAEGADGAEGEGEADTADQDGEAGTVPGTHGG